MNSSTFNVEELLNQFDDPVPATASPLSSTLDNDLFPNEPGVSQGTNQNVVSRGEESTEIINADYEECTAEKRNRFQPGSRFSSASFFNLDELRLESWILFFGGIYVLGRTPFFPVVIRVAILGLSSPLTMAIAITALWVKGNVFNGKPNYPLISRVLFAWAILQAVGSITG